VKHLLDMIPYARLLGVRIEPTEAGWDLLLPFSDDIIGDVNLPAIHGGVIGSFLELTAMLHLIDESQTLERIAKPISFSIDYLRSAGPMDTRAHAQIFKLGKRIANVHVVAWQEEPEKPVAAGNGKFLL
jgi:acyl-coenzyme A thioesterase PaaI-like protein